MEKKRAASEQLVREAEQKLEEERQKLEAQQKFEEERQKLIVQMVKLPNGATFTRLKPVGIG